MTLTALFRFSSAKIELYASDCAALNVAGSAKALRSSNRAIAYPWDDAAKADAKDQGLRVSKCKCCKGAA